ncbi:DUF2244 domain-containing protein [Paracidovorax citrulli]|uniref:DUF2244 domain-containing protein n=2 Tax=Paracidovorax citrulli TaxID=80869 RepID=A1TT19_PARC0|nr:DUF2244 domain-containing protein [Paracidovorax citrulli]ABM34107.1 conserved hypothetical protein [Paracidovorax citrulli AAC00-1]ATG93619.1 DUF2244 domain-containing protein [Paracidovorax citrulli]MVT27800.1 DUF2244 domain-containing protein [Paracidovorax citrulli]PVY63545.1 putative membrane protein [Paracidovorax citrulli]QCX09541.1 hypothetical protein APS58_0598 [Paracidovorax citrulli]
MAEAEVRARPAGAAPLPVRHWRLARSPSLTPAQYGAVFLGTAGLMLCFAAAFGAAGYWPIAVFYLLLVAGLAGACWSGARHALDGDLIVLLDNGELEICCLRGAQEQHYRFPAAWCRVECVPGRHRAERSGLCIACGRHRIALGAWGSPRRADRLAGEIRAAAATLAHEVHARELSAPLRP